MSYIDTSFVPEEFPFHVIVGFKSRHEDAVSDAQHAEEFASEYKLTRGENDIYLSCFNAVSAMIPNANALHAVLRDERVEYVSQNVVLRSKPFLKVSQPNTPEVI
ncbi:MAG: hypothetical protein AB8B83_04780 [Bdellovibrionales bacterium]